MTSRDNTEIEAATKQQTRTLTIWVPALNEEPFIALTVNELLPVARRMLDAFEIILINDGSSDRTGEIMDALARDNPEVRVIHNPRPRDVGWGVRECIARARYDNLLAVPGDHAFNIEGLKKLFAAISTADLVIGYKTRQFQSRSLLRYALSRLYTLMMNLLFGYWLRDWSGAVIFPVPASRSLELLAATPSSHLEMQVKLLRRHMSFIEIPMPLSPNQQSRSLNLKTFFDLLCTISRLLRERPAEKQG